MFNRLLKIMSIYITGAYAYGLVEIMWRGYTHISMGVLGGFCFLIIGSLNEGRLSSLGVLAQMLLSSVIITVLELLTGLVVNVWLELNVWSYAGMPMNLMGQICLPFSLIWFVLSFAAIWLEDRIRVILFKEAKKPKYKLLTFSLRKTKAYKNRAA